MEKVKVLLLTYCLAYFASGFCQEIVYSKPEITPPSPASFALGTYGGESVGLFTGSVQTQIPLYDFHSKNIKIPLQLNYSSNGIKVDDMTSNVGLGWSLSAGGIITRVVRRGADEASYAAIPESPLHYGPPAFNLLLRGAVEPVGAALDRDQFQFNFGGHQGKFFIAHDGRIVQVDPTPLKIIPVWGNPLVGFKITTPEGYLYEFLHAETTRRMGTINSGLHGNNKENTAWRLSRIVSPTGDVVDFNYDLLEESFRATRNDALVVSPLNDLQCPEDYTSSSETTRPVHPRHSWQETRQYNEVQVLREIVGSYGKVVFSHSPTANIDDSKNLLNKMTIMNLGGDIIEEVNFNYTITDNRRVFLSSVFFADPNKAYSLSYENLSAFPSRLSTAQDMYGYYNGKVTNEHLIPYFETPDDGKVYTRPNNFQSPVDYADRSVNPDYAKIGLLRRITYPTKGYTEFEYEGNTVWGVNKVYSHHQIRVELTDNAFDDVNFHTGEIDPAKPATWRTEILKYEENCSSSPHTDQVNFNLNNHNDESSTGFPIDNDHYIKMSKNEYNPSYTLEWQKTLQVSLESNTDYTLNINGNLKDDCYDAITTLNYTTYSTHPGNQYVGGLRVSKRISSSPASGSVNVTNYIYEQEELPGRSSGILEKSTIVEPYRETVLITCESVISYPSSRQYIPYTYLVYDLNSFGFIYDTQHEVVYKDVAISHGGENFENGGERYKFLYEQDSLGRDLLGDRVPNLPLTNSGVYKGEIEEIKYLENTGAELTVRKKVNNQYHKDENYRDYIYGYVVSKKFDFPQDYAYSYLCDEKDASPFVRLRCTAAHEHFYWKYNHNNDTRCIAHGNNNEIQSLGLVNPCQNNVGGTVSSYQMDNYNVYEYLMISQWKYLKQTTVTEFFNNGADSTFTATNYFYDNPKHQQLTRKKFMSSKGEDVINRFYYPDDAVSAGLGNFDLLPEEVQAYTKLGKQDKHQIKTVIQMTQEENGTETVQRKTFWNDESVLPRSVRTSKSGHSLEDRLEYIKYDSFGNVLEVKVPDGPSTSYVWGYNGRFPVAKVENAKYSEVAPLLDFYILNDFTRTDSDIRLELNKIRLGLPQSTVTSYTYKPLVGVTSITDPKGYTTYYEYDEFNRLEYVKDAAGNIISENKYKYKESSY